VFDRCILVIFLILILDLSLNLEDAIGTCQLRMEHRCQDEIKV